MFEGYVGVLLEESLVLRLMFLFSEPVERIWGVKKRRVQDCSLCVIEGGWVL